MIKNSDNKSNKESDNESDNESNKESDNESIEEMFEESEEEFIEDLKEAMSLHNNSTTNWYDENKFNKILTAIDNNNFNHKNKKGKFKLMTFITWSIILKIIQLVKQILKRK